MMNQSTSPNNPMKGKGFPTGMDTHITKVMKSIE